MPDNNKTRIHNKTNPKCQRIPAPDLKVIVKNNMKRIYLFPIPFIVTYTIGKVYEYINIKKRLLVDRFGCGSKDGFNTNDITNILILLLFLSSVVLIVVSTKKCLKI